MSGTSCGKLERLDGAVWVPHVHPRQLRTPRSGDPSARLVAGVPGGDPAVFARLAGALAPPVRLLYVLHTPRGEGEPGRYESPPVEPDELQALLARFGAYLSADARFDLWAHSPADDATIVWDRHDLLHVHGPIERLTGELTALGYTSGEPEVPVPHRHCYRAELDALAVELLRALPWEHSPLEPEDRQ